ncbi:oxidoreductase-like domain-containing protein [Neisseriaceae bacterium CLB008]
MSDPVALTPVLEEPVAPEDWACCGSGCTPCVWDTYYEEKRAYEAQQQAIKAAAAAKDEHER